MNYQIRTYRESDKEQLALMFDTFQDHFIPMDPLKRLRRLPGYGEFALSKSIKEVAEKDGAFYVVEIGKKIIGFIIVVIEKQNGSDLLSAYPTVSGTVSELYIDEEYRGNGIGTELMKKGEEYLREKGCNTVWLYVFEPNVSAHNLYKNLDFRIEILR